MNTQMKQNINAIKSAAHILVEVIPMEMLDAILEFDITEQKLNTLYREGKLNNKTKLSDALHNLKYKI